MLVWFASYCQKGILLKEEKFKAEESILTPDTDKHIFIHVLTTFRENKFYPWCM